MTEAEWLTSVDPVAMLAWAHRPRQYQGNHPVGVGRRPSNRKLRLFCHAVLIGCELGPFDENYMVSGTPITNWVNHCAGIVAPGSLLSGYPDLNRAAILRHIIGNPFRGPGPTRPCKACEGKGKIVLSIEKKGGPEIHGVVTKHYIMQLLTTMGIGCQECSGRGWHKVDPPMDKCQKCDGIPKMFYSGKTTYRNKDGDLVICEKCNGFGKVSCWHREVTASAQSVYDGNSAAVGMLHDALLDCGQIELAEHFRDITKTHPKGCAEIDFILGKE